MGIEKCDGYRLWVGGPVPPGYDGITLGDLIIVRRGCETNEQLILHERVHVDQWRQLGSFRFLRIYLGSYLKDRLRGFGHREAYQRIPLEVDACDNAAAGCATTSLTPSGRLPREAEQN